MGFDDGECPFCYNQDCSNPGVPNPENVCIKCLHKMCGDPPRVRVGNAIKSKAEAKKTCFLCKKNLICKIGMYLCPTHEGVYSGTSTEPDFDKVVDDVPSSFTHVAIDSREVCYLDCDGNLVRTNLFEYITNEN